MSLMDNTDPRRKFLLREKFAYQFPVSRRRVVEFFAGEGQMTEFWHTYADHVVAIDKDARKLRRIRHPNVETIVGDSFSIWMEHIGDAEVVDCDAYGQVLKLVELLYNQTSIRLVFFTDGTPKYMQRRYRNMRSYEIASGFSERIKALNPTLFHFEPSISGSVYYGWIYR